MRLTMARNLLSTTRHFYSILSALLDKCWITIQNIANPFKVIKVARIQWVLMARTYIGSSPLSGIFAKWVCACQRAQKTAVNV